MEVSDLLAKYGVQEGEETFPITLPGGEVLRARRLSDASQIMSLEKHVEAMRKVFQMGGGAWAEFAPVEADTLRFCVYVESLMVEPKFSFEDALRLSKSCGALILAIGAELLQHTQGLVMQSEAEAIEAAKEGSRETVTGEPS